MLVKWTAIGILPLLRLALAVETPVHRHKIQQGHIPRQAVAPAPRLFVGDASTTASSTGSSFVPSQTASISAPAYVPLTTTFTPAPECTESSLTMLSSPYYYVWMYEPVPVSGSTFPACYPSEFLKWYQTAKLKTEGFSSIVPAMSPIVCPLDWHTLRFPGSYRACCPRGYGLNSDDATVDTDRPAYGGTCFSDLTMGQTLVMSQYNNESYSGQLTSIISTMPAQAYARVIDGFVEAPEANSSSSGAGSSVGSSPHFQSPSLSGHKGASSNSSLSSGAIAGIVIGVLVGVGLFILMIWYVLRRRMLRRNGAAPIELPAKRVQTDWSMAPVPAAEKDAGPIVYEKDASQARYEMSGSETGKDAQLYDSGGRETTVAELEASSPVSPTVSPISPESAYPSARYFNSFS